MYFLPRSNKYYAWMLNTRLLYRYSTLLGFIAGLGCIWFFLVYVPFSDSINYYSHQLAMVNTQQAALEKIKNNYKKTVKTLTQLQVMYNRLVKTHVGRESLDASASFGCAAKAGVTLHNYAHTRKKDIEWAQKYNTSLSLSASLEQLINFVALMHDTPGIYMTHTFTLTAEQEHSFLLHSNFKNIFRKKI